MSATIEEVEERLRDLTDALIEAGCHAEAQSLTDHGKDFKVQTRVRRGVNAIRSQLGHWRQNPDELPDSPKIVLAANRLEDVCREALTAGFIHSAALTFGEQVRRKLTIAGVTLLCGCVLMAIPFAAVRAGFDPNDWKKERKLPPLRVPRGEEDRLRVNALERALVPESVGAVEFYPAGRCRQRLPGDARCAPAPERLWVEGRLPTYELKLPHQTYGLLFSITAPAVQKGIASTELLLAANDETPEGHYEIPLLATFFGYTPQACDLWQRLQDRCPGPRKGKGERHADVRVPVVVIDVVPGDPSRRLGEKRRAQAEAEEARRIAEERAQQISTALTQIDGLIKETGKLVAQRRWEQAHERASKLATLFEPLDGASVGQNEGDALPAEITSVRARFEQLRDKLEAFEDRVLERTFSAVTAETNRRVAEERLLAQVAAQFGISRQYVEDIYTKGADEIERRLKQRAQARLDALKAEQEARERRCGPLPLGGWDAAKQYAKRVFAEPNVEIELGECMTPRLTDRDCWVMQCDYLHKREISVERPVVVSKRQTVFYFVNGRITRHHP